MCREHGSSRESWVIRLIIARYGRIGVVFEAVTNIKNEYES